MFQYLNYNYEEDYLMCCPTNKVVKNMYSDALAYVGCGTLYFFSLQYYVAIALALWRGAVARLSIHDYKLEIKFVLTSYRKYPPWISSLEPVF